MASQAGAPFPTADAAAIAALQETLKASIDKNVEFAGRIVQRPNGTFSFTPARTQNDSNNSDPGPKVPGVRNVGTYHTHAGAFAETDEIFSPRDKIKATLAKEVSYLGTPMQRILKFTPVDLLPPDDQGANATGVVDVLQPVYVLREITIVGDPNAAGDDPDSAE